MTLPQFLNWLFSVIDRVITFFGDRFQIYIGILETINDIVNNQITQAKNYLLEHVQRIKDSIINWVNVEVSKLREWINGLFNQVYSWFSTQLANINASIGGSINQVIDFVNQISVYINDVVNETKIEIKDFINQIVTQSQDYLLGKFDWIFEIRSNILDTLQFLSGDIRNKIALLTGNTFHTIIAFSSSPLIFIMDLIGDKLLNIIGWMLASGLGSTEDNLDLTPPWRKNK